ncbi:hypothetical protein COOONC_23877 [Cooperia oncophora]
MNSSSIVSLSVFVNSKMSCVYQPVKKNTTIFIFASAANAMVETRLRSPSGEFSIEKGGNETKVATFHNATEEGDYEICLGASIPSKVFLFLLANAHGSHILNFELWNADDEHIHNDINVCAHLTLLSTRSGLFQFEA